MHNREDLTHSVRDFARAMRGNAAGDFSEADEAAISKFVAHIAVPDRVPTTPSLIGRTAADTIDETRPERTPSATEVGSRTRASTTASDSPIHQSSTEPSTPNKQHSGTENHQQPQQATPSQEEAERTKAKHREENSKAHPDPKRSSR